MIIDDECVKAALFDYAVSKIENRHFTNRTLNILGFTEEQLNEAVEDALKIYTKCDKCEKPLSKYNVHELSDGGVICCRCLLEWVANRPKVT
jgi:hypothetical protein